LHEKFLSIIIACAMSIARQAEDIKYAICPLQLKQLTEVGQQEEQRGIILLLLDERASGRNARRKANLYQYYRRAG
jgi:hypothetical protein